MSNTSKPSPLLTPIQYVKGVGPKLGAVLARRGIATVRDLLWFFPRSYEDRSRFSGISELREGMKATVLVTVERVTLIPINRGARQILDVTCSDGAARLSLKWFNFFPGMEQKFVKGRSLIVTGVARNFRGGMSMVHPEIHSKGVSADGSADFGRIIPIYIELEEIPSRTFRRILWNALEKFGSAIEDDLPAEILRRYGFPAKAACVRYVHFPEEGAGEGELQRLALMDTLFHQHLIYEEFFKFEYLVLRKRLHERALRARTYEERALRETADTLAGRLPFRLTQGQTQALDHILRNFSLPGTSPMHRLIQGDVGSGKTVVALLAAASVIAQGGQVAMMAPTEILAEQHFSTVARFFGTNLPAALLTGKTPAGERRGLFEKLAAAEPMLVVGTHALIEDPVVFANLVYVIIDEQHRFGVEQRRKLRSKGGDFSPHTLVMTATPIPRTLALTAYGDLSVSSIRELPPGRSPVQTVIVDSRGRLGAYDRIRRELRGGRQAYFICPLIEQSEAEGFEDLKAATQEYERLQRDVFPEFKVALLHGQIKNDEKNAIMEQFRSGAVQILVSTTVVEVGVDVPNATVMAIEHANRFGLSQLHQLRGRVGRGQHQSHCYLFANTSTNSVGGTRLEILTQTNDGFKIAEADLEIRGPGEFLGVKQSGDLPFRMANLVRDQKWLITARNDVLEVLRNDEGLLLPAHAPLKRFYEAYGKLQVERYQTG